MCIRIINFHFFFTRVVHYRSLPYLLRMINYIQISRILSYLYTCSKLITRMKYDENASLWAKVLLANRGKMIL